MPFDPLKLIGPLRPHIRAFYQRILPALYVRHLADFYLRCEQELRLLPLLLRPGQTAVDVGAHAGAYAWHLLNITDRVEAFEPNPEFARLLRNAFKSRLRVHQIALSDQASHASLEIPFDSQTARHSPPEARLAMPSDPQIIAASSKVVDVETASLDGFGFADVGLIKVDVEGHELNVLRGAAGILSQQRPNLLVESEIRHRASAIQSLTEFLAGFGYQGFYLFKDKLCPIVGFHPGLQDSANFHTEAWGAEREYVNNFIFIQTEAVPAFVTGVANLLGNPEGSPLPR